MNEPAPVGGARSVLRHPAVWWTTVALIALALGLLSIWTWRVQTETSRALLRERIDTVLAGDRATSDAIWPEPEPPPGLEPRIARWFPDRASRVALAGLPTRPNNEWPTIFVLYDGERPKCMLALTPIAGWLNDARIDARAHPDRLLSRALAPGELAALERLHAMVAGRAADMLAANPVDAQSPLYTWLTNVANQASQIIEANR
jgi:hypothetical protein